MAPSCLPIHYAALYTKPLNPSITCHSCPLGPETQDCQHARAHFYYPFDESALSSPAPLSHESSEITKLSHITILASLAWNSQCFFSFHIHWGPTSFVFSNVPRTPNHLSDTFALAGVLVELFQTWSHIDLGHSLTSWVTSSKEKTNRDPGENSLPYYSKAWLTSFCLSLSSLQWR